MMWVQVVMLHREGAVAALPTPPEASEEAIIIIVSDKHLLPVSSQLLARLGGGHCKPLVHIHLLGRSLTKV